MATFGIFVAFGDDKSAAIKGNSAVVGYKDWVLGVGLNLNTQAERGHGPKGKRDGKVTAMSYPISLVLHGGSANAEIFAALFATKKLDKVIIHQCLQPVDKASDKKPELVQKIELKDVYITSASESWEPNNERVISIELDYAHILLTVKEKPADFTVRNTDE